MNPNMNPNTCANTTTFAQYNVYEYIGNENDFDSRMIFQSVNDDSYIILTEKDFIEDDIQIL